MTSILRDVVARVKPSGSIISLSLIENRSVYPQVEVVQIMVSGSESDTIMQTEPDSPGGEEKINFSELFCARGESDDSRLTLPSPGGASPLNSLLTWSRRRSARLKPSEAVSVPGRWSAISRRRCGVLSASCIASSHFPNGMGRSLSSVMSPTDPTVICPCWCRRSCCL